MFDGCRRNSGDREYVEGYGKGLVFYICGRGVCMHGAVAGCGEEVWDAVESGERGEGGEVRIMSWAISAIYSRGSMGRHWIAFGTSLSDGLVGFLRYPATKAV